MVFADRLRELARELDAPQPEALRVELERKLRTALNAMEDVLAPAKKGRERVTLIECIATGSLVAQNLAPGETVPAFFARMKATSTAFGDVRLLAKTPETGRAAVFARDIYETYFRESAATLDMGRLEDALIAWTNTSGAGKGKVSKWTVISDVAVSAGLGKVAPRNVQREWLKFEKTRKDPITAELLRHDLQLQGVLARNPGMPRWAALVAVSLSAQLPHVDSALIEQDMFDYVRQEREGSSSSK